MTRNKPTTHDQIDKCVQVLNELMVDRQEFFKRHQPIPQLNNYLEDLCTIGFTIPRQSGASSWLAQRVIKSPNAIGLVMGQQDIEAFYSSHSSDGTMLKITEVRDDRGLAVKYLSRFFTAKSINNHINSNAGHPLFNSDLKELYILDSHRFFSSVRKKKFYLWLELWASADLQITLVN